MSKQSIKTTIDANIRQNGQQLITGQVLNSVLNQMVDGLADETEVLKSVPQSLSSNARKQALDNIGAAGVVAEKFLSLAELPSYYGWVNRSGNKIYADNSLQYIIVPIKAGDEVKFTCGAKNCTYGVLNGLIPVVNTGNISILPYLVATYPILYTITPGNTRELTIPSDGKYVLLTSYDNGSCLPTTFTINGEEKMTNILDKLNEVKAEEDAKIASLATDVENVSVIYKDETTLQVTRQNHVVYSDAVITRNDSASNGQYIAYSLQGVTDKILYRLKNNSAYARSVVVSMFPSIPGNNESVSVIPGAEIRSFSIEAGQEVSGEYVCGHDGYFVMQGYNIGNDAYIQFISLDVKDGESLPVIVKELNKIDARPYTPTNNILWLGTSIPSGSEYPIASCRANGYNCIRKTLGSSFMRFGGRSLTTTNAEYDSHKAEFINTEGYSEAEWQRNKDNSYENVVLPYINGTASEQVSMIVIDHGYNDRGLIHSEWANRENIDWTSEDRTTFHGAFRYLINRIQEINPFIKIVIGGYFTDTVYRVTGTGFGNNVFGKEICQYQQMIASKFEMPILKVWEHSQIANYYIKGTSTYVSDFNATYGKSYPRLDLVDENGNVIQDAEGNVSAYQIICMDGVHPHADLTGNAQIRLNAIYTKMLSRII